MGIVAQQFRVFPANQKINLRIREIRAQLPRQRGCQNNIADGTQADDQNFSGMPESVGWIVFIGTFHFLHFTDIRITLS